MNEDGRTYADVVRQLKGRPLVQLPLSQLTMGRTSPPWNALAWTMTEDCQVRDDVMCVRYPRGCGFLAAPHCLPATDVTLWYRVRFKPGFDLRRCGELPGLEACGRGSRRGTHKFRPAWLPGGKVIARRGPQNVLEKADLNLNMNDTWNTIVLRVKLNDIDTYGPVSNGAMTLSVNGRAATLGAQTWRQTSDIKIRHIIMRTFHAFYTWKSPSTTAEFEKFCIVA